jgi:hypothetical protein
VEQVWCEQATHCTMYNSARRGPTYMIPTTGPVAAACVVAVNAAMTTGTRHTLLKAAMCDIALSR